MVVNDPDGILRQNFDNDPVIRMEVLLRDPGSHTADGTELVPEPQWLEWAEVAYLHPFDKMRGRMCDHSETMCLECVESWNADHYIRMTTSAGKVFYSPDYPKGVDQ